MSLVNLPSWLLKRADTSWRMAVSLDETMVAISDRLFTETKTITSGNYSMAIDLANVFLPIFVEKVYQRLFLPGQEGADSPVLFRTASLSTTSTLSGCYALLQGDIDPLYPTEHYSVH